MIGRAAWLLALVYGALAFDVPGWRGTGALVVGLLLLLPVPPRLRAALAATAAAPLLLPAALSGSVGVAALLVVAAARAEEPAWRVPIGAGVAAFGALVAFKQVIAAAVLPPALEAAPGLLAVGLVAALALLGTPSGREAGGGLLVAGAVAAAGGLSLAARLDDLSLPDAAAQVTARQAWRLVPRLEERALAGEDGASAVIATAPRRARVGAEVTRRLGPDTALDAGWDPRGAVPEDVVVPVAWALEARGELGRAIHLLRRQPRVGEVAFHLSTLAGEAGDATLAAHAWARATPPLGAVAAPGILLSGEALTTGGAHQWLVAAHEPVSALRIRARGQAWEGLPELVVHIGGHVLGPFEVPESGGEWRWSLDLPVGGHRLVVVYPNDAAGPGGDRNILDLEIEALSAGDDR